MNAQRAGLPMMDAPPDAKDDTAGATGPSPVPPVSRAAGADPDELLARARGGDIEAFRRLVRLHQGRVFSIALRHTGRHSEAEELTQDVFVQLHGTLGHIDDASHLLHWLLRTVVHRCIDRQRHARRRPRLVSIDCAPEAADEMARDGGGDPLASAHLRHLVLQLKPDARAVLLLRFQEDQDPADIAMTLGMSVNTVKSHLRRSLDWLRTRYPGVEHGP